MSSDAPLPLSGTTPLAVAPVPAPAPVPVPSVPTTGPAGPVGPRPAAPPSQHQQAWTQPRAPRRDGLSRDTGRLLAVAFGTAFVLAPVVEPTPAVPMPEFPLWQLPIELAGLAAIVAAVVVLWRGGRNGARLGAAAGVLMAALTIICPLAGHSTVGWWTWVQTGLSLFVLGTSAALMAGAGRRPTAGPAPR
jgi:peptidoglycan/LPS O-acetylase OafA/YrhL